jgi:hypothetical protein
MFEFPRRNLRPRPEEPAAAQAAELLTALGIIFGVAAVIIMVAIGEGTKQAALSSCGSSGRTTSCALDRAAREQRRRQPRQQRVFATG